MRWLRNACPHTVMKQLRGRAARGQLTVTRVVTLSADELARRRAAAQTYIDAEGRERVAEVADIEEDSLGNLRGMGALTIDPQQVVSEIKNLYKDLKALSAEAEPKYQKAKKLADEVSRLPEKVDTLYQYADEARDFLSEENLSLILELPWEPTIRDALTEIFSDSRIANAVAHDPAFV